MASASVLQSESATGFFPRLARWCEQQVSRPGASAAAIAFVVLWFVSGPLYGWSNAWQLIILEAKPETAVEEIREAFDELREEVEDEVRPRSRREPGLSLSGIVWIG